MAEQCGDLTTMLKRMTMMITMRMGLYGVCPRLETMLSSSGRPSCSNRIKKVEITREMLGPKDMKMCVVSTAIFCVHRYVTPLTRWALLASFERLQRNRQKVQNLKIELGRIRSKGTVARLHSSARISDTQCNADASFICLMS